MARSATLSYGVVSRNGSILAGLGQTLLLFALTTLPTPLYGDYAKTFGFSTFTLTLIYATYVVGTLVTLFAFGRLSDQLGRRPVAMLAIAMAALAALLFLSATNVAWLFAARLVTVWRRDCLPAPRLPGCENCMGQSKAKPGCSGRCSSI